eukprot:g8127.t1
MSELDQGHFLLLESGEAKPDAKEVEKTKEAQPAASPQSTPKDAPTPKEARTQRSEGGRAAALQSSLRKRNEPPAEISAKRKETASQQLGQVVERAAKSARSGEGAPVKKLPVAPKARLAARFASPKATGESTAASPSLTPRASPPAHIVVDATTPGATPVEPPEPPEPPEPQAPAEQPAEPAAETAVPMEVTTAPMPSVADVEAQNRWAELENAFVALEAERDGDLAGFWGSVRHGRPRGEIAEELVWLQL